MKRRSLMLTAFASLLLVAVLAAPTHALDEADRLWLVGERAFADGLHALARRTLERFVERHPRDQRVPDAVLLLGRARLSLGDTAAALEAFRRAQTIQPPPGRPLEVRFWEAEALFRLRRFAEARTAYDAVISADAASPLAPHALYGFAWTEQELGRPEGAARAFGDFLNAWPDHALAPSATFYLARALVDLKRFPEALPLLESFTRKHSGHQLVPEARYLLGWTEQELGRPEGAARAFGDFLNARPDHALAPSATFYLARALVDLKRFPEALPLLESFTRKHSGHQFVADAKYLLGWTRLQTGDARGGLADLRAFVGAHPQHAEAATARRLITQAAARHGDRAEMLDAYKALMAEAPATPEGLNEAASIASRLGRSGDQEAAWRKLLTDFPDHALSRRVALDLASAAYKRKDWKEVVSQAAPATKSDEEAVRAEAWLLTGEAELKLKQFPAAEKAFTAVVGVTNTEPSIRFRALAGLGLAHEEQRQWRQALSAYESVAKSPDPTLREWARERATAVKARMAPPPAKKPKTGS